MWHLYDTDSGLLISAPEIKVHLIPDKSVGRVISIKFVSFQNSRMYIQELMRHSRAGISLCPFGVRVIEVRLYLYISIRICEIVLSGANVYVVPRFRASMPKSFGLQAILPYQRFVPHEFKIQTTWLCVQETGGLALTEGPKIIDMLLCHV